MTLGNRLVAKVHRFHTCAAGSRINNGRLKSLLKVDPVHTPDETFRPTVMESSNGNGFEALAALCNSAEWKTWCGRVSLMLMDDALTPSPAPLR